jgi:hypothetical protein
MAASRCACRRDGCCSRKKEGHSWAARTPLTTPCSEAEPFKCGLAGNMVSFPQPRLVKPTHASVRVVLPQAPARASRAPQVPKRSQPPHEFPLLQHSSLQLRSKVTRSVWQAEFVELLSLCSDPTACPSDARRYSNVPSVLIIVQPSLGPSGRQPATFSRDPFGTSVTHSNHGSVLDPSSSHSR